MRASSRFATVVVLLVTLAAWASCHIYVATYASRMPFQDDLEFVPALQPSSTEPSTFAWWWAQANEHRIPLPRLIYVGLLKTTHDFRSGMHFQVVAQALLALGLVLFVRKLRGSTSFADALFPLLLLQWGNGENFLLGMQITTSVPTALVCTFLMLGLASAGRPNGRASSAMGACLFLLPLNGGFGLMQAPALLAWSVYAATTQLRSNEPATRKSGLAFAVAVFATCALIVGYFVGFEFPYNHHRTSDVAAIARAALGLLALNFGPMVRDVPIPAMLATLVFGGAAAWFALRGLRGTTEERVRASLCLATMLCTCTIALAIGVSRAIDGPQVGMAARYSTLPTPFFVAAFLALTLFASRRVATPLQGGACVLMLAALPFDTVIGRDTGRRRAAIAAEFESAVHENRSVEELVARFGRDFYPNRPQFESSLRGLIDARWPPFDAYKSDGADPYDRPFFLWTTQPTATKSPSSAQFRYLADAPVVMLSAECELTFALPPTARTVQARYGLPTLPSKRNSGGVQSKAGLRVRLLLHEKSGEPRVLFERALRPSENEADRGRQSLDVTLPPHGRGELVLETRFADGSSNEAGWSCWTEFAIR
ncbi:MAG: hypothetical protein K8S98_07585 [Planctomycetes bacterium]|nr:hypothetical protein [Planctomycetota bacterium]